MMMRTIRLRDGSVIRVALWRDAATGRIALALEADLGWAPEPAALPAPVTRPRIEGGPPRLVLRPRVARLAGPAKPVRRVAAATLRLAPPPPPPPRAWRRGGAVLRLTRQDGPLPSQLASSLAALKAPAPPRPTIDLGRRGNATLAALHPESKILATFVAPALPVSSEPPATGYDAAFLLGPIAG